MPGATSWLLFILLNYIQVAKVKIFFINDTLTAFFAEYFQHLSPELFFSQNLRRLIPTITVRQPLSNFTD